MLVRGRRILGHRVALGAFAALSLAVFCSTVRASQAPLSTLRDVPLPGPASRFDYASLDEARGRLYIAHLGAGTIVVFDTRGSRVVAEIPAVAAVHGVLAIPSLGRVYATATGTNEVVAIDEATNRIIARMPGGEYPDGMAFDPITERLFVSDEAGGTDTVIDVRANRVVQEIALVEIDPATAGIVARHSLPGCRHAHGLLIDARRRLAFIACDGNATLLVFDLQVGRVIGTQSVGPDPDVLALDAGMHWLYVAAESGIVTVFAEGADSLQKLGEIRAGYAHVVVVDSTDHRVYLPLQNVGGHPVLRIAMPTK
ncbi:MAG: YncE family protein [Bacillati bacterium ANGP1]|uniref:YncE family protein n=1 Tax=Candidatus Segetimicrobium genomatis TaxID=2569760 RepID=A0A537J9R0_9BACT|nr:MAG: YncE family protein [Terrabacteria group bacterium ANGP1]